MISSSDSDDDCYGNAPLKLRTLKSTYQGNKLNSVSLLNDSLEITELINSNKPNTACTKDKQSQNKEIVLESDISDDAAIDAIIASNSKRVTRASRRFRPYEAPNLNNTKSRGKSKSRGRARGRKPPINEIPSCCTESLDIAINQGRGSRGRRRSRRNMGNRQAMESVYPTFSVGNCDEYEDLSNNIQLFSNSTNVQVIEDEFDENEELSVKVVWQSLEIVKFTIRKFQKLTQLYEFFSNKANVSSDRLLFMYNDKILKPDDTPDTIDYNIAKFIEGGIINNIISKTNNDSKVEGSTEGIRIKFQYPNSKKPFTIQVKKDDLLLKSMTMCAEHIERPLKNLKFEFDGYCISGQTTARDLEMEGGECIDVKIIN